MYRVVKTFKKQNDSDIWLTPSPIYGNITYFSEEEKSNEMADFVNLTFNSTGVSNVDVKYTSTNEMTMTYEVDTLENFNNYENAIMNHPFSMLRNRKLREYNIPQYLIFRNITEV